MKWIGNPFPGNGKCEIQSKMCPTAVQDKCTSEWRGKQSKELLMKQGGNRRLGLGGGNPGGMWEGGIEKWGWAGDLAC